MSLPAAIARTDHRPWPLPDGPWMTRQAWRKLLFAHWRVPAERMRAVVPRELELDTFDGSAWLGVVPFTIDVRLRGLPPLPTARTFPELNVRTYVRVGDRPGVWFLSLDAASTLFVIGGRVLFLLPYYRARMESADDAGWVRYRSRRAHPGAPAAELAVRYRPTGPDAEPAAGSLEHFLTERYRLYAVRRGRVLHADVHHPPWRLAPAEAELERCTLAAPAGLPLEGPPHLLHAARQDMVGWPLRLGERVTEPGSRF